MDLSVVPQGLEVAHPLHRAGDGLPVDDVPGAKGDLRSKALPDEAGEDLQLDLSHEL